VLCVCNVYFYCLFALVYLSPLSIACVLLFSVCCAASLCEINYSRRRIWVLPRFF